MESFGHTELHVADATPHLATFVQTSAQVTVDGGAPTTAASPELVVLLPPEPLLHAASITADTAIANEGPRTRMDDLPGRLL